MRKTLTILGAVVLVAAIAIPVLAHSPGWGRGHHGMGYWGGGPGHCWLYGRGYEDLTAEQRSQLDKLHQKFYDETAQLRNEIWSKQAELDSLLNSPNPDSEKAKALQKEISDLKAKIAQERLSLELEEHKIVPKGYRGRAWGWGYHGYPMRGYAPGGCWS